MDKLNLWLDPIPDGLRREAITAIQKRDAVGFLCLASNTHGLDLVFFNSALLKSLGLYEEALLHAFISTRGNNAAWPHRELIDFFTQGDRDKFLAAGDPLPGHGPFTLYRGVAGVGRQRRERGLSWTSELDLAWWFAYRAAGWGLPNPGVVSIAIKAANVIAYLHGEDAGRGENEFIVMLPKGIRLSRRPDTEGRECSDRYEREKQEQQMQWIKSVTKGGKK